MTPAMQLHRAHINRANSKHSTGPRTESGKRRSSLNALTHGLTAQSAVLPSEDRAAYDLHRHALIEEHKPKTPTENILVKDIADTSWRLKRIPLLEAELFHRATNPPNEQAAIEFDIVDAHHALAWLSLHDTRLSRKLHKTIDKLRELQAERRQNERREIKRACGILEMHKHKGIPYDPSQDGFVFSKDQLEAHSERLVRHNQARHFEYVFFEMQPPPTTPSVSAGTFG